MSLFDWFKGADHEGAPAPVVDSLDKLALYQKAWCPYCQRVKAVIGELDLEITEYDTNEPAHLQALLAGGGQRMVPCLRIEHAPGQYYWLYESMDIIAYLRRHFGERA
ncbi:glutaredoxin [Zobellella endophytica]|uniref:Glutaredoxin n=1 Tax=Zobellella endophytica TaxID=2116700 RepID=A0A2P7QWS0_9GAMM|nr:glutathione S-transferase N-terminal domain-containing protein [Zobellella endophytica]PSJ42416.1 glutaredoxin [Zobellella endophytica]